MPFNQVCKGHDASKKKKLNKSLDRYLCDNQKVKEVPDRSKPSNGE